MTAPSVAGHGVVEARVYMPRLGAWVGEFYLDARDAVEGVVDVVLGDTLTLRGYARPARSSVHLDAVFCRVVGGAGGLRNLAAPRDYKDVPLRLPLVDLLVGAGEALAATSTASLLARRLAHWAVAGQEVSTAIAALLTGQADAAWRVLPSGEVWAGIETWPASDAELVLLDDQPIDASALFGVDEPQLLPGTTIAPEGTARQVGDVEHTIVNDTLRTRAWFVDAQRPRSHGGVFAALARAALPRAIYLGLYPGRVEAQPDERTVDVRLDNGDLFGPGVSGASLRLGLPGASCTIAAGASVLVGWEEGDPSRPYAAQWPGDETVSALNLFASLVTLGGSSGAEFVALSNLVANNLNALKTALDGWTPVANDGGAALKTILTTLFATWPTSTAASQVKAK